MKTIEEILDKEMTKIVVASKGSLDSISFTSDLAKAVFKNTCIKYAEEAIKADRINLLEHSFARKTGFKKQIGFRNLKDENNNIVGNPVPVMSNDEYEVDKNSILNAPNIQLL